MIAIKWRMLPAAGLSLLVFALPGAWAEAEADAVSLRPHWKPGDERRYDLTAEYRQSSTDGQGAAVDRRAAQAARLLLHVNAVDAAGGATVRLSFESLHAELAGPENQSGEVFDWTAGADGAPENPDPSALARLSRALADCTMVAEVAPDGSVASVTGLMPLAKALQQEGGDSSALMGIGFFSPIRLKGNLATLWQVDPEGRPREPGAQWRTADHLALGKGFDADAVTVWTLAAADGPTAKLTAIVTLTPSIGKREADPAAPKLELKAQSGTVLADWDVPSGILAGRTDELASTWTATVDLGPGASTAQVTAEASATSRVEIKLVK